MVLNHGTFNCLRQQHLRHCCCASSCVVQTYPQPLTGVYFLADIYLDWSLSIWFHTGCETTLQCCWLLDILDLAKLRKKIHSFSYYDVYRCGLFHRRSQGINCGEQRKEKKMLTCLETLKSFAKQHSCVPHLNNFTEKNPCTSKKGHQIWNEKSISEALSR